MYGHDRQHQLRYDKMNECGEKLMSRNENFRRLLNRTWQQNNKSKLKLKANCIIHFPIAGNDSRGKLHSSNIDQKVLYFNIFTNTVFHLSMHFQFFYLFPLALNCTITNLQYVYVRNDYDNIAWRQLCIKKYNRFSEPSKRTKKQENKKIISVTKVIQYTYKWKLLNNFLR